MAIQIQLRRGTSTEWTNNNPVLAEGEMGVETDTDRFKIGDGTTAWSTLPYGGLQGEQGEAGQGIPIGGTTGQQLVKASNSDFDTTWTDPAATAQVEAIIKSGTAAVANNVLPPGLRIPEALLASEAYVRLGTAPTGANFIVEFNRNGVLFATVTVPAGVASGSATGLAEQFVAGDVLTWDITQVGSTTAGSDVAAAIFGTLG